MSSSQKHPVVLTLRKSWLVWGICFNLGAAIALFIAFGLAVGAGRLTVLSNYRDWDLNGVISHEGLNAYKGGLYSGGWATLPRGLNGKAFRYIEIAGIACVILFLINVAVLIYLVIAIKKQTGDDS